MRPTNILLLSFLVHCANSSLPPFCDFATAKKYLGIFNVDHGSTKEEPYQNIKVRDSEECKEKCRKDDKCLAVSIDFTKLCSFYNTSELNIVHDGSKTFYIWKKCDWSISIEPADGRCPGMFIKYYDRAITVLNSYLILKSIPETTDHDCLDACLHHPICEAVTFNTFLNNCSLHQSWPHNRVSETYLSGRDIYRWTCIPDFFETLPLPKDHSQPNIQKCTGYWNMSSRNAFFHSTGVSFHTQSYKICLEECTMHSSCYKALFNVTHTICILPFTETSDRNEYLESLTYVEFVWICVRNDTKGLPMNRIERNYMKKGLECVTLVRNEEVFIAEDICASVPGEKHFSPCERKMSVSKTWNVSDVCLVNQSFWKYPTKVFAMRPRDKATKYLTRIFTGLTSFWMAFSEDNIYRNESFIECRRFDGSKGTKLISSKKITSRKQWYAFKPQGERPPVKGRRTYIVLSASQQPFYGCRTVRSCSSLLRNLQIFYFEGSGNTNKYSDIPYNFMIDESGNIYEGRGWNYACMAVGRLNYFSLCIGFIGTFAKMKPSLEFLKSVKMLIEFAVEKKYVETNYTLYIHQDATKVKISRNYAIVIKEWFRYRGYVPKDCSILTLPILLINILLMVIVSVSLYIIHKLVHPTQNCKKCAFLHHIRLRQIYPKILKTYDYELKNFVGLKQNTIRCVIREKGTHQYERNFMKNLSVWFLNRHLAGMSTKYSNCDMEEYLDHIQLYKEKVKVYEAEVRNCPGRMEDNIHIVLLTTQMNTLSKFESLSSNGLCLCVYFEILFLTYLDILFY